MKAPLVSIVVPTYNRREALRATLASLERQTHPKEAFEVIVVDDASTDGTDQQVERLRSESSVLIKYLRHSRNRGRAAACNTGARNARGEIVVLLDGDIIVNAEMVMEHVKCHLKEGKIAVIGDVELSKRAPQKPFFQFLLRQEELNRRALRNHRHCVPLRWCLTGHFSVKKADLERVGYFEEGMTRYGWEDIELAYRLREGGVRTIYHPQAYGEHLAAVTDLKGYCERHRLAGEMAARFYGKHPTPEIRRILRINRWPSLEAQDTPSWVSPLKILSRLLLRTPFTLDLLTSRAVLRVVWSVVRGLEQRGAGELLFLLYHWMRDLHYFRGLGDGFTRRVDDHRH